MSGGYPMRRMWPPQTPRPGTAREKGHLTANATPDPFWESFQSRRNAAIRSFGWIAALQRLLSATDGQEKAAGGDRRKGKGKRGVEGRERRHGVRYKPPLIRAPVLVCILRMFRATTSVSIVPPPRREQMSSIKKLAGPGSHRQWGRGGGRNNQRNDGPETVGVSGVWQVGAASFRSTVATVRSVPSRSSIAPVYEDRVSRT
jgi:hypothetical protein